MKYLNNLCTSIGLTLIYIFVIRILDFHPSDLPFLLLHFIARFIIARSEIRRSLVSALNRNTTTKMTSYFCEIDLSYACTPHGNGYYGILPQCLILVRPLKHGIRRSAVFCGRRSRTTYFVSFRRLFMTSARGKSNHTLIEFVHARLHYLRQFGL